MLNPIQSPKRCFLLAAVIICGITSGRSQAESWPRLKGQSQSEQCLQAFQIADNAFKSKSPYLYAPPIIPRDFDSVLVLAPMSLDISGGDALDVDAEIFEKLPHAEKINRRSSYWQVNAKHGYRLVVRERSYGWRGDTYSLFAIAEEISPQQFFSDSSEYIENPPITPVISDSWRPPLILLDNKSRELWVIDVGDPSDTLADWRIYIADENGLSPICTVVFGPDVKSPVRLLPQPVRELARLLDQTIGPGNDEGTLQPTARLRIHVKGTWTNAALRPWSLLEPYNTREQVDAGLEAWSQKSASYLKLYRAIRHQYPIAERSLTRYYQNSFGKVAGEARMLATSVLDNAFRSHFAFPNR